MKLSRITFIAAVLLAASCQEQTIIPVSEKIQGPLGDYFEVVSKDYKPNDGRIYVEIKRIKEGFPGPWSQGMSLGYTSGTFEPQFTIELQSADGNLVSNDETSIVYDDERLNEIASLGVGESSSISFSCGRGAAQFKMGSTFEVHESSASAAVFDNGDYDDDDDDDDDFYDDDDDDEDDFYDDEDNEDDDVRKGKSSDWESILKDYEKYVDSYIKMYKKAMEGDLSAMTQYAEMLEKAESISNKLEKAEGDMSSSQWSRYMKLVQKMTNALIGE